MERAERRFYLVLFRADAAPELTCGVGGQKLFIQLKPEKHQRGELKKIL